MAKFHLLISASSIAFFFSSSSAAFLAASAFFLWSSSSFFFAASSLSKSKSKFKKLKIKIEPVLLGADLLPRRLLVLQTLQLGLLLGPGGEFQLLVLKEFNYEFLKSWCNYSAVTPFHCLSARVMVCNVRVCM